MLGSDADLIASLEALGGETLFIAGVKVMGIFQDPYTSAQPGDAVMESSSPQVMCRSFDVASVTTGTVLERAGVSYRVLTKQPDGTGMTVLVLELA